MKRVTKYSYAFEVSYSMVQSFHWNGSLKIQPTVYSFTYSIVISWPSESLAANIGCYVYSSHYKSLAQHVVPQFISSLNFSFKNSCHPRTTSPRSSLHPSLIWDQISCHPHTTRPKVHVILASGPKVHVIPQQVALGTTCSGMTRTLVLNERMR